MEPKVNITYKKIKRIYLRVRNNEVYITAPFRTPPKQIRELIDNNIDKINELLNKGNVFSIWGKEYEIVYQESDVNEVVLVDKCYCYYTKDKEKVIDKYFSNELSNEVESIIKKYKVKMNEYNLNFNKLVIRKMASRWGSCKPNDRKITLNSNLAKYDKIYLEYVFCHEIAHLKYANHSNDFHNFLEILFPNAKKVRKELKKHC